MRRIECRDRGRGSWGIQWIRQQIIVGEILVATKTALQVVPLVLVRSEAQSVVGIASPSKAVQVEIVKQEALVIERLHGQCLIKYSRAGLQIHQGIVHIGASGHVSGAKAQFDRGVNLVSAAVEAILG